MFSRQLLSQLNDELAHSPAVALLGPRQVGKTTLAFEATKAIPSIYLDLESERDRAKLSQPELYLGDHLDKLVILDEAQNTTPEQMKMFLTRIGFGSKAVVTGDVSQIDLPSDQVSGLIDAERVLKGVDGIAICRLTSADVVRHPLVARIVDAYDARSGDDEALPTLPKRPRRTTR